MWESRPILVQPCLTLDYEFVCLTVCVVACGCLTPKQCVRQRVLSKWSNDLALSQGRHVLHAPTLVGGQDCYRVSLDSGLCVHLKVCICCLALHLLANRLSLGVRGSATHGKLHLGDHFMDVRGRWTVPAKSWFSSVLGNADKRVNIYFYIPIIQCVFRLS